MKLAGSLALLVLVAGCASGESPGGSAAEKAPTLGSAVASKADPIVVPSSAKLVGTSKGRTTYALPAGVGEQDVVDWYRSKSNPEQDLAADFIYVGRRLDLPDALVEWVYCDTEETDDTYVARTLKVGHAPKVDGGSTLLSMGYTSDTEPVELCLDLQLSIEDPL